MTNKVSIWRLSSYSFAVQIENGKWDIYHKHIRFTAFGKNEEEEEDEEEEEEEKEKGKIKKKKKKKKKKEERAKKKK